MTNNDDHDTFLIFSKIICGDPALADSIMCKLFGKCGKNYDCETKICECDRALVKALYDEVLRSGWPQKDPGCSEFTGFIDKSKQKKKTTENITHNRGSIQCNQGNKYEIINYLEFISILNLVVIKNG